MVQSFQRSLGAQPRTERAQELHKARRRLGDVAVVVRVLVGHVHRLVDGAEQRHLEPRDLALVVEELGTEAESVGPVDRTHRECPQASARSSFTWISSAARVATMPRVSFWIVEVLR